MMSELTLDKLLPYSALTMPLVWAKPTDKAWLVSSLLNRYLGSYTDCVAIIDSGQLVGVIDGRDLLGQVVKNPTHDFFKNSTASDFMVSEKPLTIHEFTLIDLIKKWSNSRRAYAILKNTNDNLCTISARTVSEAAICRCNGLNDSNIQKNAIVTCSIDNTVGEVLELMFSKKVRRIFYDDYQSFISDRAIIKKIVTDLEFFLKTDKFLDMQISQIESIPPIAVKNNLSLPELIKSMINHENPCLLFPDNTVMTYYDIATSLGKFWI